MSLFCADSSDCDCDAEWWYEQSDIEKPLETKRSRKCCSCGNKINVGQISREIFRHRRAKDDVEDKIYGEDAEIQLASWYLWEECSNLAFSLEEQGFGYSVGTGESIREQIKNYFGVKG